MVRVAVAQIEPRRGEVAHNLELITARLEEAAAAGCQLVVLPEAAVSGYVYDDPAEAMLVAEEVPGPSTEAIAERCRGLGLHAVVGMLERTGDRLRNAAPLIGPDGVVANYRKTHLPFLGVDRFVDPGDDPFVVHDLPFGRVGVEICFDLRFPEQTRALALEGAEIVAHPTNWPVQAAPLADFMTRSRAVENRIFLLTANRVGVENGAQFCGTSQIVDPSGQRLAMAGTAEETLLVADLDLDQARTKEIVPQRGVYEMPLWAQRKPELYGRLTEVG